MMALKDSGRAKTGILRGALIGLVLAGGVSQIAEAQTATPKRGGTVVFATGADPVTLSRNFGSNTTDGFIACILYQGLTRIDAKGDVQPMLAKSWTTSPDGKTFSFDLVKANWQDGKPFTSEDVKYSLIQISAKYSSIFAGAGAVIDPIETPAPDKAIIRLKQPYGPFLLSLACPQGGAILPKHVYEGTNPPTNPATTSTPVGLGPFILKEWKRGDYLRMVKNPDYWEPGKPYLDEVIAKVLPQPSTRTQALQAGEVDHVSYYYFPANDYGAVRADPKLRLTPSTAAPGVDYMFLNVKRKPFDDKRVRQALMMATDREALLKTAYLGVGDVGTMPFTNKIKWSANPDIDFRKMYPFDPARANALLDEAGVKRGADGIRFKAEVVFAADDPDPPLVAVALKSMWRNIGVDVVVSGLERVAATKRMFEAMDGDVVLVGYTSFGDPALGIARAFVTSSIGKQFGNPSGYSNPEVDKLFEEGERAPTQEGRGVAYRKVQTILADDLPVFNLHERALFDGITAKLHGIEDEFFLISWRDAWIDK